MGFFVADEKSAQHETEAIHDLSDRLHEKFDAVAPAVIDEVIETHYHELDASPIRDYVPVLVENAATTDLFQLAHAR